MTTFRIDPDLDYVVGRSGADWDTNVITGWGGLMAVIRGLGLTAAAAGDTILLGPASGANGKLSRLVRLTVNNTANWVTGDTLSDNSTKDHWHGKLVQIITANTSVLVQLNQGYQIDDIITSEGVDNDTHPGNSATCSAKVAEGITIDGAAGTIAAPISIIGVNADGNDDGSMVTLDGNSDATTGFYLYKHYWKFKNLLVALTTTYGWRTNVDQYVAGAEWDNCEANNAGSIAGFYLNNASYAGNLWRCRAINNTGDGFYKQGYYQGYTFEACEAIGNGGMGFRLTGSDRGNDSIQCCVAAANTGHGIYWAGIRGRGIFNSVIDGNGPTGGGDGIYVAAGAYARIIGNRITNNGGTSGSHYGINVASGAAAYYGWNFLLGNRTAPTNGVVAPIGHGSTANTNVTAGTEGYKSKGSSAYDYRLTEDATGIHNTIVLGTSSPANSAITISMGLPRPAPAYPAVADVEDGVFYGFNDYYEGTLAGGSCDYPVVGDVRSGVQYGSGVYTGTLALPAVGDVQSGVQFGSGGTQYTGTFAAPAVGDVQSGVGYGAGGTEFSGTFAWPAVGNVRTAIGYGAGGTEYTGNATFPPAGDVQEGVQYGAGGTEYTGNFVVPAPGEVLGSVGFGADGTEYTGMLALPAEGDVQDGVQFGAGGDEYTGTFAYPTASQVLTGIGFGAGGTEWTGNVVLPAVGDVQSGVQFGPSSGSTGTFAWPSAGNVLVSVGYGAGGTEYTGTFDEPARNTDPGQANVRSGTGYKIQNATKTGNATFPATGDVQSGVQYGTSGTQYTGTFSVPTEAQVLDGVGFGAAGTEFTGTLEPGSEADYPAESDVRAGVEFGSEAYTGTLDLPADGDVRAGVKYDGETKTGRVVLPPEIKVLQGEGYGTDGTEFEGELAGEGLEENDDVSITEEEVTIR